MAILFLVIMFSGMGFGLVLPPFMFVATQLGASEMLAGFIVSSFAMGQFFATPVWGKLSDKHGRKPILIITMFGSALAYLIMALADYSGSLWMLLAGRFATGLMAGNFAAATAYVTDITPPEKRAQGMGMVGGAVSLGFMAGPALGGLLSGDTVETASLFWPSVAAAGISIFTMFAILFFLKESLPPEQRHLGKHADDSKPRPPLPSFREILSRPLLAQMVLMGFLVFFATTNFETIFPLWADAGFGWGPRQVGFMFMYLGFMVMVTQMFITGKLVPILGEGKVLLLAVGSYIFGLLFMTSVPFMTEPASWQMMLLGITFTSVGGAMFNTASTTWVSKQAGDHERGAVLGLFQSAGWLGRSIGPTVSGFFFMTLGANAPLYAAACFMLPVLVIITVIRRRHAAEEAAAES